jgi:cell division protein FtsW
MAIVMGAIGVLLAAAARLGAFGVIVAISMGILFLGGVNGKLFASISGALTIVFMLVIWLSPWRREHIFAISIRGRRPMRSARPISCPIH